jgi:uncharacterized membrane protein YccC
MAIASSASTQSVDGERPQTAAEQLLQLRHYAEVLSKHLEALKRIDAPMKVLEQVEQALAECERRIAELESPSELSRTGSR